MGECRIGLALSDPGGVIATPLGFIECASTPSDVSAILGKASEHGAGSILVGMPLTKNGKVGPQAREVERFCQALREGTSLDVVTWDERYSTVEAERLLRQAGRQPSREKGRTDAAAAAVILQSYLDSMMRP